MWWSVQVMDKYGRWMIISVPFCSRCHAIACKKRVRKTNHFWLKVRVKYYRSLL